MPELPEVEVVRAGLEQHVVGAKVKQVFVLHPRPVRSYLPGPAAFSLALKEQRITGAKRRGKYLWLPLSGGDALQVHLGMSGQMKVTEPSMPDERHLRVRFVLSKGRELRFIDQRMFGGLGIDRLEKDERGERPASIAHIAADPFEDVFDADAVVTRIRRSSSGIKRLLLNQAVISGVGNIYADEALWRAGLHGERPGEKLTATQVHALLAHLDMVMREALTQGGTSFDSLYVNVNGESGYFSRSLHAYGREGEACERCGTAIVRAQFMNRSSFFCPVCQPAPRVARRVSD